jgi:hypothetical protein
MAAAAILPWRMTHGCGIATCQLRQLAASAVNSGQHFKFWPICDDISFFGNTRSISDFLLS